MKKSFGIMFMIFMIIVLLGSFLESKLSANVTVHNNTGKSIEIGLLWTSIKNVSSGYINSYQWVRLPPGGKYTFVTDTPPVFTECYWVAIRNSRNGINNYNVNINGKIFYYTTNVILPSNNKEIRLNDYVLAGMRGIGGNMFGGSWNVFFDKLRSAGYMPIYYNCIKIWTAFKENTHYSNLNLMFGMGVDGKYTFGYQFQ
jgi:hypothetical protein